MDHADGNKSGLVHHVEFHGLHGVDGLDHMGRAVDRVHPQVGIAAVGVLAPDGHLKIVAGGAHRTRCHGNGAQGEGRHHVHAEDGVRPGIGEGTILDHGRCAQVLFIGLEEKDHRTGDFLTAPGEDFGNLKLNGNVAVMAAGVHDAGVLGAEGQVVFLRDGQGVHIRPEHHHFARLAALQHADDAGSGATAHPQAQFFQPRFNNAGSAEFLEAQLGVGVNVPPDGDGLIVEGRRLLFQINLHKLVHFRRSYCLVSCLM